MSNALLATLPRNLRVKGKPVRFVDSDVFNVAQRVREIDPNLYIVLQEGHDVPWVVMEMCRDGETRMVKRYDELTPAILDDLRRMLVIPFQQRIEEMQKEADLKNDAAKRHRESDAWQEFLWDFNKTLQEANMVDRKWYRSYRFDGKKRHKGGV